MRILYIDVDSLRPDHLGCYGYFRNTSPNLDALASEAVRFDNLYVSDAPCLPSRTALWSERCGFRTGVVGHGGTAVQPFVEGPARGFNDLFGDGGWMGALRRAGYRPATVSSFADRHSAWHWYAGYLEILNPGMHGYERAHQVNAHTLDWLRRHGSEDNWFLHVNYWDPHTPYRTPESYGQPFEGEPLPAWLSEDCIESIVHRGWCSAGPHSPQEPNGFGEEDWHLRYPRQPQRVASADDVRAFVDGYDTGIRYLDNHLGELLNLLANLNVLDETVIMVSADHGEALGELNVWGDHHAADHLTCRVPLLVRWPGLTAEARTDSALHHPFDWAATLLELLGGSAPETWDGRSFAAAFRAGREEGRPFLVTSQQAWMCQRGVRFGHYLCLRSYHDGYKLLPPLMLFDLENDPHEQHDLASERPDLTDRAMGYLAEWHQEMALRSGSDVDPMMTVLRAGGPYQVRGKLAGYLARLKATGRAHLAEELTRKHPHEL